MKFSQSWIFFNRFRKSLKPILILLSKWGTDVINSKMPKWYPVKGQWSAVSALIWYGFPNTRDLWVIMMKVWEKHGAASLQLQQKEYKHWDGSVCLPHRLLSLQLASGSGISACAEGRNRGMLRERKPDPSGGRPDSDQFKQRSRNIFKESGSIAMVLHVNPAFLKDYYEDAEYLHFQLCSDPATRQGEIFRLMRKIWRIWCLAPEGKIRSRSCCLTILFIILCICLSRNFRRKGFSRRHFISARKNWMQLIGWFGISIEITAEELDWICLQRRADIIPAMFLSFLKHIWGLIFMTTWQESVSERQRAHWAGADAKILDIAHGTWTLRI